MNKKKNLLALSIIAAMGNAQAAGVTVRLTEIRYGGGFEYLLPTLSGTRSGVYDDVTDTVTMNAGTATAVFDLNPLPDNDLYTHHLTNFSWDLSAGSLSLAAFSCVEGQFGPSVGAALCGYYNFGANYINESSTNYNTIPGTRAIGGDDMALGPQQQGADYTALLRSWDGTTLIADSPTWSDTGTTDNAGYQLIFTTIPVPAAALLFGSALGLLGWMRRKAV